MVHECTFEEFTGTGPFDLCLFSESFQYIPLAESLPKCAALLAPGGQVLIADCFRTEAYWAAPRRGRSPVAGIGWPRFRMALERSAFAVAAEEDITDAVAPSIDLEQQLFNVIGHGVTRVSDEIRAKRPTAHWTLARFIGMFLSAKRRREPDARLTGTERNAEAFRRFNRYLMLRLGTERLTLGTALQVILRIRHEYIFRLHFVNDFGQSHPASSN